MGKTKKKKYDPINTTMSLGDHLEELRARLILAILGLVVGTIICLIFGSKIISIIEIPYIKVMGQEARMQTIAPAEGFVSYMKIVFISGLIISCPWVFYQIWMFVAAGLYEHERRYVMTAIPFSAALFIAGALFFLFVGAWFTLRFLVLFNEKVLDVESIFTFPNYVSFVTTLMLVFGLAFQTPIAIFILNRTGLVSIEALRKSRKYVLIAVFIIGAVSTPPDIVSQILLAIPLYGLFEIGIILSLLSERKRASANK
jgi:sec-independent protein translocase protein TatC